VELIRFEVDKPAKHDDCNTQSEERLVFPSSRRCVCALWKCFTGSLPGSVS
jgi:hypothetical protein